MKREEEEGRKENPPPLSIVFAPAPTLAQQLH